MQRSVSDTRRSVATRPYASASGRCMLTTRVYGAADRARTPLTVRPIASNGAAPTGTCGSSSADVGSCFAARPCCSSPTPACLLGRWQLHRLEDKKAGNAIIRTNQKAAARSGRPRAPARRGPARDRAVRRRHGDRHLRRVARPVIVRYQTRDGDAGVDVVVPLVTADGTALLVDRGWLATANRGSATPRRCPRRRPGGSPSPAGSARMRPASATEVVNALHPGDLQRADRAGDRHPASTAASCELHTESPKPANAAGPAEPARPQQRTALLLRAPVVVLRAPRALRLRLPRLGGVHRTGRDLRRAQQPATKNGPLGAGGSQGAHDPAVDRQHRAADEGRGRAQQERRGTAELLRLPVAPQRDALRGPRSGRRRVALERVQLGDPLGADPARAAAR